MPTPVAGVADEDHSTGGSMSPSAPSKGRVLVLEDDPALREIIDDCLTGNGYTVVAVPSGGEGVREVLAGDFTMILCDFMMPGLPGDMFYRAVERIRPALCQRFIFMTGHQGDAGTNEFIKSVNGFVLKKPFLLAALLDSLSLAEVRRSYESVCDGIPAGTVSPRTGGPSAGILLDGNSCPDGASLDEKVARILARVRSQSPPVRIAGEIRAVEPDPCAGSGRRFMVAALALLVLLAGGLSKWYFNVRDGLEAASAQRTALDSQWAATSAQLEEAVAAQAKMQLAQRQLTRIVADRTKPRWTPVLRSIIPPGNARIDILEVGARGEVKDSGACEVRIRGAADDLEPRLAADRFRQAVEANVKGIANGRSVAASFENLEDVATALPDQKRAEFVMTVTVNATGPSVAISEEGR